MAVTFTSRQLGRRLKRLRGKRSLRQVEATGILGSTATIRRLEAGQSVTLTFPAIGRAAAYYGAPPALCEELEEMYKASQRDKPWGDSFKDSMIKGFPLLLDLEEMASEILIFEPNLVTGLFQTEAYALDLHRRHGLDEPTIEVRLELTRQRQSAFWDRDDLAVVKLLMGEWALPRDPGQLERLKRASSQVRVLPTEGTPHPFVRGPFTLFRFPAAMDEPDCLYTEGLEGSRYEEDRETTALYDRIFERSFDRARPIEEY